MTNVTVQEALKSAIKLIEEVADLEHEEVIPVMEGLKAALAEVEASSTGISNNAIEKCEPVGEVSIDYQGFMAYRQLKDLPEGYHKVYTSPQPIDKCEPVAWINDNLICPEIGYESTITTEHPRDLGWQPLYTSPISKEWVGLTDEELMEFRVGCFALFEYGQKVNNTLMQINAPKE